MKVKHFLHGNTVDLAKRTAMFSYQNEGESWTTLQVKLSGLLVSRMSNMDKERQLTFGQTYEDYEYTSEQRSPHYHDSPFNLVMRTPGNTDVPLNATLECVDQGFKAIKDVFTDKILSYDKLINRKAETWKRYDVQTSKIMLKDLLYRPEPLLRTVRVNRPSFN